jgi:hypothetical protein
VPVASSTAASLFLAPAALFKHARRANPPILVR